MGTGAQKLLNLHGLHRLWAPQTVSAATLQQAREMLVRGRKLFRSSLKSGMDEFPALANAVRQFAHEDGALALMRVQFHM